MSVRTILIAVVAFLAGAATLLAASSAFDSSDPRAVPPVEVRPPQEQPRQSETRRKQRERRERARRRAQRERRGGFD
ncbi:MAG: hypothetical protein M3401_03495, partial [Actinomycetota bacterium]|nr:hypothetical protein [Actinomycetota bacterium]